MDWYARNNHPSDLQEKNCFLLACSIELRKSSYAKPHCLVSEFILSANDNAVLQKGKIRLVYVIQVDEDGNIKTQLPKTEDAQFIDYVLVDGLVGGSGDAYDWNNLQVCQLSSVLICIPLVLLVYFRDNRCIYCCFPCVQIPQGLCKYGAFLAGGLKPENVAEAIQIVRYCTYYLCVPSSGFCYYRFLGVSKSVILTHCVFLRCH